MQRTLRRLTDSFRVVASPAPADPAVPGIATEEDVSAENDATRIF